jgi:hypothetical protein
VGGLYRDKDLEVVTGWLKKLMRDQVEAAYQTVRKEYFPLPAAAASPSSGVPTTDYPSPSSPTASEGARPDASSHLAEDAGGSSRTARRMPPPQADASKEEGSSRARAGDDDGPRSDRADQPTSTSRKRRRRRSSPKGGDCEIKVVAGKRQRSF